METLSDAGLLEGKEKEGKKRQKGLTVDVFREEQLSKSEITGPDAFTWTQSLIGPKEAKMEFGTTLDVSP